MANDYLLDREIQRTTSYTGIWGVNDQDRAIQESMGPIYDRRKEHLGTSDQAIITARRRLLNLARELQHGIEPFPASHGDIYRVRAMDVNTAVDDFDAVIASTVTACSPRCNAVGWPPKRVAAKWLPSRNPRITVFCHQE